MNNKITNKKKLISAVIAVTLIAIVVTGIILYNKGNQHSKCAGSETYTVAKSENINKDYQFKTMADKNYAYSEELEIGIRTYEITQTNELNFNTKIPRPTGWTSTDYNIAHSLYMNGVYQYLELNQLEQQLEQKKELKQIDICKLSNQIHGDVRKDINKFLFNSKYIAIDTWFSVEKLSAEEQKQLFSTLSMSKQERNETLKKLVEKTYLTTISRTASNPTPRRYPLVEYRDGKEHPVGKVWESDLMISVYHEDQNQAPVEGRDEYKESIKIASDFEKKQVTEKEEKTKILFQPVHY